MKLSELISEYTANGYVLLSKGNGSTDPMWINYHEAIEIDASIADIEMHVEDFTGCYTITLHFASDWLDLGDGSDYRFRILF